LSRADIENIAGEIASVGRTEKREHVSRPTVLRLDVLKWRFQPNERSKSWERFIATSRGQLIEHLDDSLFPVERPWSFAEIMDDGFWPN
jgi:hypothetical protein